MVKKELKIYFMLNRVKSKYGKKQKTVICILDIY